ncbi:NUDIX hydrolase [Acidaminobacter sp. JC074]|uniref:NUDIX hydrolase n=1 Tax=Acidaminobacter sp. JC074 TaxID=2530199 RepID=UPI001F11741F|nr:NUDIX hydrolase [Acidaminobacter sp. JC074]MCH4888972.1 NUDIX hydrolase [Acidaminobacter sp. JC074]
MNEVISAGGIVYYKDKILMLRKKNGDWVLPKGRIENGETLEETAIREVKEETNVDAIILDYIGITSYSFSNFWTDYQMINKTVSWYLMEAKSFDLEPLMEEGFVKAAFIESSKVVKMAKYDDERKVIRKALEAIK